MFRFAHIEILYALAVLPAMLIVFLLLRRWKKKAMANYGDWQVIQTLMPDYSKSRPILKFVLYLFAILCIVIGIADPQIGSKLEEVKREGVDLMICLDVSNSMLAEDLQPNRLENAKQAISRLVDNLQGDRIGIIVFAGQAYVQLPITTDYAAAKLFLQNVDNEIVPTQGTAIGAAIELAVNSFSKESKNKKAIIVLTDGENHEDDAVKETEKALDNDIVVHTIGMGSEQGAPIPTYQNKLRIGFKKDNAGSTVVTKLNETMLQQIASAGKGIYVRANNSQTGLSIVFNEINKMEKKEYGSKQFTDYEDRFQYFIGAALLFLMAEFLLSERKSKFWKKVNLKI